MVIIYITLVTTFAIDYFSAALTGSFIWEAAVTLVPGKIPLSGIRNGTVDYAGQAASDSYLPITAITDDISPFTSTNVVDYNSEIIKMVSASASIAWGTPTYVRGLYLAQVNPYGIHVESMESISNSMWNPWNECWLGPLPIHCSMDIMDSIWNDHGMVMEWSIPYGIHHYSTWIPLDSIWNLGISTMDSMEQVHMDSMEQIQMELMTIIFVVSLLF